MTACSTLEAEVWGSSYESRAQTMCKPGHGIVAEVNGKALAVFNVDGQFHVIDNTCLHRGGPLGEGELEANVVTCPWHGWQFNVTTGVCVNNPSAKVETLSGQSRRR